MKEFNLTINVGLDNNPHQANQVKNLLFYSLELQNNLTPVKHRTSFRTAQSSEPTAVINTSFRTASRDPQRTEKAIKGALEKLCKLTDQAAISFRLQHKDEIQNGLVKDFKHRLYSDWEGVQFNKNYFIER